MLLFYTGSALGSLLPLRCSISCGRRRQTLALRVTRCSVFGCSIYFTLLAASPLCPVWAAGAEFCMQRVTLVLFLPSLHSIAWGKEEPCREEVNGAGKERSVLVEDSAWGAERSLQSLIRC